MLCRSAVVMPEQATEEATAADAVAEYSVARKIVIIRPGPGRRQRPVPEPLVRPMELEESDVFLVDVIELGRIGEGGGLPREGEAVVQREPVEAVPVAHRVQALRASLRR